MAGRDDEGAASEGRWARRKEVTRAAIVAAAMRLFDEQGFHATTVQQIADAAQVSERTFFRYFESKEDLLLTDFVTVLGEAASGLALRPLEEAPLEAIHQAVRSVALAADGGLVAFALGTRWSTPPSPTRLVRVFMEWEDRLGRILVGRFVAQGADPSSTEVLLRAAVTARTAVAATRTALRHVRALPRDGRQGAATLGEVLALAFGIVADGCPPPSLPATRRTHVRQGR